MCERSLSAGACAVLSLNQGWLGMMPDGQMPSVAFCHPIWLCYY